MKTTMRLFFLNLFIASSLFAAAQELQKVEGYDTVLFHYNGNRSLSTIDYLGNTRGYMTAAWWAKGQMQKNILSWRTAVVPEKKPTTFSFVGASAPLPAEFSVGPKVKLTVNGNYALTFNIGMMRNFTWKEGGYELSYTSQRVEYPYFGTMREFHPDGNSGLYQLTVPADAVEAGKSVVIEVEMVPFDRWNNGWFMVKTYKDVLKQENIQRLQGEINSLRNDAAVLSEQTQILATKVYNKMLGTDDLQHQVVYTNGYRHLHPADLIKLKNGELLLMAREGTEHIADDGDVIMLRSKDGGKTWGDKTTIAGIKNVDEREGCGIQLKDGTIVVAIFYNGLYFPDGAYFLWKPDRQLAKDTVRPRLGTYIITSKDNGKTWSAPNYIDIKGMPVNGLEGPTDAPIEMPDGSIVMGVIGYSLHGDPKNTGSILLRSTDKGKTWNYVSTIASDPGGKLGNFVEPGIVRTKTGRLVVGLRNHGPEQAIWMTYSDDDGKTWAPPFQTDMIGHPVDLIQLKDGRLMASYGIREAHAKPGGIRVCFSNDNGKTWDIKTEKQLRNDFINMDIGYPESLEYPGGKMLTVYYYNLFGKYFLSETFWQLDRNKK
ncbi:sialidase family protein [Flavisolibacter ginsenosidimutans]|uniref:Exo-alpha-sialidase n=1 Tax=Flavisolibacter ginsenosidimutans TaxID=661481 RepID=A0A5B8UCV6_9BACT|nr:sialidase family protein [Flavisolibacter ginsenosidimutans]QEC54394.1 exo-alpha-sialidase [Flavisolibacter ginsenosidimutans]